MERKHSDTPMCANVDMYSGLVYAMLGIPEEVFTPLFASARIAGWCANRIEEVVTCHRIMRPAYQIGAPCGVAGIHDHRQVRQPLQHRDGGHIQRGAGGGQAAADAPLAQDHLLVAAGEDILCRQQQLLHGGGGAPLQQDGLARLSKRLQQGKVLHIPRAHLPHVHIGQ